MKNNPINKLVVACICLGTLISTSINAQVNQYSFNTTAESYSEISGGNIIGNAASDDQYFLDPAVPLGVTNIQTGVGLPIGFNFVFNGGVFNKFGVNNNGWIVLGNNSVNFTGSIQYRPLTATTVPNVISAFSLDLEARSNSSLCYQTIGTSPSRTLIVQWKNYMRYNSTTFDSLNFQIQLNETSSTVSFVYGKIYTVSATPYTPQVGIKGAGNDFNLRSTISDWSATIAGSDNTANCSFSNSIYPSIGTAFTWTPPLPCFGIQAAGIALVSQNVSCVSSYTVSLVGASQNTGVSYQWQVSADSSSWQDIQGASSTSYNVTQAIPQYYRCAVSCGASTTYSNGALVSGSSSSQSCYCNTNLHDDGCSGSIIATVSITGTSLNNANSGCFGVNGDSYTAFAPIGNNTADLTIGSTYTLNVTSSASSIISVWLDYDHNGKFDYYEWTQVILSSTANVASPVSLTIPSSALDGLTAMRIRSRVSGTDNNDTSACTIFHSGETEDYFITLTNPIPCVAPPTAGVASSDVSSVCSDVAFNLQLTGNSTGGGMSYQWQSSSNGILWSAIQGANSGYYSGNQSQDSHYRCYVTCNGMSDTSNAVAIAMSPLSTCYCSSTATNIADDDIGNVTFGTLNNGVGTPALNNSTSHLSYTDFTNLPPQSYIQTFSYPISVTQINSGSFFTCWANVFIDYNQDGDFVDPGERVFSAQSFNTVGGNVMSGNVIIPLTATPGNTRMRIVLSETSSAAQNPCNNYSYGETEDYIVTIVPIAPCVAPPTAGTTASSAISVCPNSDFTLSIIGNSIGLGQTYQWQSSADGIIWNDVAGAIYTSLITNEATATYFHCNVTCSGSTVASASLQVPLAPGAATFTNTTGGLITDNNTTVLFPITVSGLASQINTSYGITGVCINIQHNETGELKIFLKSPAGDTVYLSVNNGGLFPNYTNTCFAMNGANGYIYTGNAPFTGIFIPQESINHFNNNQNPNGTWYVGILDEAPSVTPPGHLLNASISFCVNPPVDPVIPTGPCSLANPFNCKCPDGTQNCDLRPDMTACALIIQNDHPESNGYLRLSNATPNIGWGPMEIHGSGQCFCDSIAVACSTTICPNGHQVKELVKQKIYHKNNGVMTSYDHDAGFMSYHPSHGHVHVDSWGAFSLRIPTSNPDATTWPVVGTGAKVSFCLINLGNCTSNPGYCVNPAGMVISQADIANNGFGSVTGCGKDQGIFTGSLDIYSSGLDGMQIDFPGICNGNYAIVSITDPNNNFLEENENNNWVQVPVTLTQQFAPTGVTSFGFSFLGWNTVSFTNTTPLVAAGYLWDFGDGTTDTTANPVHQFAKTGPYSVKLIAINQCYTATSQTLLFTGVNETPSSVLGFSANPNPTTGNISLAYYLSEKTRVEIDVYNLVGEKITSLINETQNAGKRTIDFDTKSIGMKAGVYLLKIRTGNSAQTLRLVVMD